MSDKMKSILMQWLAALVLLLWVNFAQATISCSISSPGFTAGYPVNSASIIITQTSYSITCSRSNNLLDATTTTYSVKVDSGTNPQGANNNRATSGSNTIRYDTYTDSACGTKWQGNTTIPSSAGTITMVGLTPTTVTQNFWGCIGAGISPTAGTYTDTVTMTPTYGLLVSGGSNTFPVTIITPPTCTISSSPGTVVFSYTSFSTTAATASTTFGVTCSNSLPYTMAVSPASGTLVGISYSLSLPASSTGTGVQQTQTISGTAAAGQAGTCATGTCSGIQSTTLTITY